MGIVVIRNRPDLWLVNRRAGAGVALLLALALSPPAAVAAIGEDEEEEISIGSVASSIPETFAAQKRDLAASRGYSFLSGVTAFVISDDNLYRSPSALEQDGTGWGNQVFLQADRRWKQSDKLVANLTWSQTQQPQHSNANSAYVKATGFYLHRFGGGLRIECDLDLSHKNDDATTIAGVDYARDYSYWRYAAEADLVWRITGHHMVTLSADGIRKDYSETSGLNSIDWDEWDASSEYRLRFAPYHYLTLLYSIGERDYREELAATGDGTELPEAPAERHRYQTIGTTYTLPVGSDARFEAHYDHSKKSDLFAGYESNEADTIRLRGGLNLSQRFETRLGFEQLWRDYENILGDRDRKLEYSLWQLEFGSRFRVVDRTWLFGSIRYYARDTNNSDGSYYRDYNGAVSTLGMGLFF